MITNNLKIQIQNQKYIYIYIYRHPQLDFQNLLVFLIIQNLYI